MMRRLLDMLFPPKCVLCYVLLPNGREYICEKCGREAKRCIRPAAARGTCYERAEAPFVYCGNVRQGMLRYKYKGRKRCAGFFAEEMARLCESTDMHADVIVPVPSSKLRSFKKGYDHAFLLAKGLSENMGIPVERHLYKTRRTKPMHGLKPEERRANILDSIGLRGDVSGKTVLLADDIITSGATASECAKVLRRGGAASVLVITAAAKD